MKRLTTTAIILFSIFMVDISHAALVAHWTLDEGIDSTAYDSSGNNNDGEIYGAGWVDNGNGGYALSFDGEDDYVEVPYDPSYFCTGEITVEMIFKTSNLTQRGKGLLSKKNNAGWAFRIDVDVSGKFLAKTSFSSGDKSLYFPLSDLSIDTWHRVAMTYDGGEMKLYLDGELKDSLEPNGTLDDKNDQCLFFGAELDSSGCSRHSGTYADVTIDEVLIYDHALDYDAPIPTLSEWGIIIFMTIMMGIGVVIIYRRRIV